MYHVVRHLLTTGTVARRIWWLRLDHPLLMPVDLGSLVQLVTSLARATQEEPLYLFLDELTYANQWDRWLKTFFDDRWPVRIVGSSSCTAILRDAGHESGIGRWEEHYLSTYLFLEYLNLIGHVIDVPTGETFLDTLRMCARSDIEWRGLERHRRRFMITGGFPELLLTRKPDQDEVTAMLDSQRTLRNDAVERAIYKDIPQSFGVTDPMMLERILYILAGQVTDILSPTSICTNLNGLSQPTFERYLSYLTQSYLVFTLPNYSGSEISRQKRGRKLYFVDGAIRNAALQRGAAPLDDPVEMGVLLENMAAGHLHALSQQTQVRLHHWRDGQSEVDLVYDHPTKPLAIEVASSIKHPRAGLLELIRRFPRFKNAAFLVAPNAPVHWPTGDDEPIGTLPLDLILLAASAHASKELLGRLAR